MTEMTGQEKGSDYQRQEGQEKNVCHKSGVAPICKTVGFVKLDLEQECASKGTLLLGLQGRKQKIKHSLKPW